MDSFLLLRRLVAAIVFKGQTVSDYWWSRRTIFLTVSSGSTLATPNLNFRRIRACCKGFLFRNRTLLVRFI